MTFAALPAQAKREATGLRLTDGDSYSPDLLRRNAASAVLPYDEFHLGECTAPGKPIDHMNSFCSMSESFAS